MNQAFMSIVHANAHSQAHEVVGARRRAKSCKTYHHTTNEKTWHQTHQGDRFQRFTTEILVALGCVSKPKDL